MLKEHQGKGLGRWMMECLNAVLDEWPDLRGLMLIASSSSPGAAELYRKTLGVHEWGHGDPNYHLKVFEKRGKGRVGLEDAKAAAAIVSDTEEHDVRPAVGGLALQAPTLDQ